MEGNYFIPKHHMQSELDRYTSNTYGKNIEMEVENETMYMIVAIIYNSFLSKLFAFPLQNSQKKSAFEKNILITRCNIRSVGSVIVHLFNEWIINNVPFSTETRLEIEPRVDPFYLDADLEGDAEWRSKNRLPNSTPKNFSYFVD